MPLYKCETCAKIFHKKADYTSHVHKKINCDDKSTGEQSKEHSLKFENVDENILSTMEAAHIDAIDNRDANVAALNSFLTKKGYVAKKHTIKFRALCDHFEIDHKGIDTSNVDDADDIINELRGELESEDSKTFCIGDIISPKKKTMTKKSKKTERVESKAESEIVIATNSGNSIASCVNACHNILRNNDAIVGTKAMHDIMRLLFLKFLEPLIVNGDIDILNSDYYKNDQFYMEGMELLAKFSEFRAHTGTTSEDVTKNMWKSILCNFPLTSHIFRADDYFNCSQNTMPELVEKIHTSLKGADFDELDNDVKGRLYEEFLNGYGNNAGKDFGQYFTTRKYISVIFAMIDSVHVHNFKARIAEGKFSAFDPCMGTAGFLTETYKFLELCGVDQYSLISGNEIEAETFTYALMNMILTTGGLVQDNFKCVNSLVECDPLNKKTFIPTNPPYGIKTNYANLKIKYDTFHGDEEKTFPTFKDVYPIKTNDSVALFLQMLVYKLEVGGMCCPIIPDGQLLFGKNFAKLRKYIMSMCRVEKILYTPGGAFKHAGVKTAVLFLVKTDGDNTDFNVQCFKTTKDLTEPVSAGSISVDAENNWSWDMSYYVAQETPTLDNCEWKTLGELCTIECGRFNSNDMDNKGDIPFYSCICDNPAGVHSVHSFDLDDKYLIFIGSGGSENNRDGDNVGMGKCYIVSGKTACRSGVFCITCDNTLNINYFQRYIMCNKGYINSHAKFSGNLGIISKGRLENIKIPVPSLDVQNAIVAELDQLELAKESARTNLGHMKWVRDQYRKHANPPFAEHKDEIKWTPLDKLCEIKTGDYITKATSETGEYPVYGGGGISSYINKFNRSDEIVIAKDGMSEQCVRFVRGKFFLNHHGWTLKSDMQMFLYYYLESIQDKIYNMARGSAQKGLSQDKISILKIPVLPLDVQAEFVQFYEAKDQKINEMNADIAKAEEQLQWLNELGRMTIKNMICSA